MNSVHTKNKVNTVLFIISVVLVVVTMFLAIGQKKGFMEDEIFSYGSSNYMYDNMFYTTDDRSCENQVIEEYIITDNFFETVGNAFHYITHRSEFRGLVESKMVQKPIWKTSEEAKNYLTASPGEWWNYISPYYNQSKDVHPPLFYFAVHFVSSFVPGVFSKYIIFSINLLSLVGACFVLRKIFILLNKENLMVPATLLYGLSVGAASTVVFLRMYAMVTFFVCLYFYLTLKFIKKDFVLDKKLKWQLIATTVLGFLTQYFMCLFILPVVILICTKMIMDADFKKEKLFAYLKCHIISALLGVLIFPSSIYHIFFSYRGFGSSEQTSLFRQACTMFDRTFYAFSLPNVVGYLILVAFLVFVIVKIATKKTDSLFMPALFALPVIVFILLAAKMSPNFSKDAMMRYIMPILPMVAVCLVIGAEYVFSLIRGLKPVVVTCFVYVLVLLSIVSGALFGVPAFLYPEEETQDMAIAEKYKTVHHVFLSDNYFTYLSALPEMTVFEKTMIINYRDENQRSTLSSDEELLNGDQFVVSMESWLASGSDRDNLLNEILEMTGYNHVEPISDPNSTSRHLFYLISK